MPHLLIELFSEEIPARMQSKAADDLKSRMTDALVESGLTYGGAAAFSTPRRLTLVVEDLPPRSPDVREERRGPRVDAPDKAIEGFLRGAGVSRDDLETIEDKKGTFFLARIEKPGRDAAEIVAEALDTVIRNFPWPKSMRWGSGSLRWVRPLQSILCILYDDAGADVVPFEIEGIKADSRTRGHRFMGSRAFAVGSFDEYVTRLKRNHVILNAQERADHIWQDATNMAFAAGLELVEDRGLLNEVAGLVEWPVPLMGRIDDAFLDLPPEVLQTSMKEHQKFFSVRNPNTGRIERFVTVANIQTPDDGATILAGNIKVLNARLSDAKFFWENDLRTVESQGMQAWTDQLFNVTFHARLGSQADRIARIAALARELAPVLGANADLAEQAAHVAKADLSSEMVYEFPELQGLMGRYYANAAGLPLEVADACEHHYSPLGPGDAVPAGTIALTVALADKLDTLAGFWAIDEKPTGSKDPYALRRAALGVIRIVLERGIRLSLLQFVSGADLPQAEKPSWHLGLDDERKSDLLSFFHDRLKVHLKGEGLRHDVIDASLAMPGSDDLTLLVMRARALGAFLATEDGENLVQGFKRANNILTQAEERDGVEYSYGADIKFAEVEEEKALFAALRSAEERIKPAMGAENFGEAMQAMADLRGPVDAFFEAVQVNAENQVVRRNRLNLLGRIRSICLQVADLSRIEG